VCVCVCVCVCVYVCGIVCNELDDATMMSCDAGKEYGPPTPDESKDSAEPGAESSVQQTAGQHARLQVVRAGYAAVTLVFLWCNRACEAHRLQKVLKQV